MAGAFARLAGWLLVGWLVVCFGCLVGCLVGVFALFRLERG
jgi:hypothetical protein